MTLMSGQDPDPDPTDLAPWIRIRIEIRYKSWIRIRIHSTGGEVTFSLTRRWC
jgi:hypothetical protein